MASSDWLTVGEARALLGVSRAKMAQLVKRGAFRKYEGEQIDKRLTLISRADVERLASMPRGGKSGPKALAVA